MKRRSKLTLATLAFNLTLSLSALAQMDASFTTYRDDVVDMIDFRAKAFTEYKKLHEKTSHNIPLIGIELNSIHQAVVDRKIISTRIIEDLLQKIESVEEIHKKIKKEINKIPGEGETELRFSFENNDETILTDKELRTVIRFIGMSTTLIDNYIQAIYFYQDDPTLRRIINEKDSVPGKPGKELKTKLKLMLTRKNVKKFKHALEIFSNQYKVYEGLANRDEEFNFFFNLIKNSYIFDEATNGEIKKELDDEGNFLDFDENRFDRILIKLIRSKRKRSDFINSGADLFVGTLSKWFGNTAGMVQLRSGYLKDKPEVIAHMKSTLKPLDVLFEKTPFRLTDRFIPGYYGHNAIWIGSEAELKDLGIWEHPFIKPLQERVRNGQSIVEALRPGVTTNNVEHFLDIDDMAVIRIKEMSKDEIRKNILVAASQYGKKYDFNFDVETQDQLVCSELISMSFLNIPFKNESVLGRWTINPDHIAEKAIPNGVFETVILYTGGVKQTKNLNEKMQYTLENADKKDSELLEGFKKIDGE